MSPQQPSVSQTDKFPSISRPPSTHSCSHSPTHPVPPNPKNQLCDTHNTSGSLFRSRNVPTNTHAHAYTHTLTHANTQRRKYMHLRPLRGGQRESDRQSVQLPTCENDTMHANMHSCIQPHSHAPTSSPTNRQDRTSQDRRTDILITLYLSPSPSFFLRPPHYPGVSQVSQAGRQQTKATLIAGRSADKEVMQSGGQKVRWLSVCLSPCQQASLSLRVSPLCQNPSPTSICMHLQNLSDSSTGSVSPPVSACGGRSGKFNQRGQCSPVETKGFRRGRAGNDFIERGRMLEPCIGPSEGPCRMQGCVLSIGTWRTFWRRSVSKRSSEVLVVFRQGPWREF
mmetsp:Transcript_52915/g.103483  ORF Transcript_52915/g.103483 Transcript_52915/m.103483 type:complete len:339 (+) Transcript_52915:629-1645(+)